MKAVANNQKAAHCYWYHSHATHHQRDNIKSRGNENHLRIALSWIAIIIMICLAFIRLHFLKHISLHSPQLNTKFKRNFYRFSFFSFKFTKLLNWIPNAIRNSSINLCNYLSWNNWNAFVPIHTILLVLSAWLAGCSDGAILSGEVRRWNDEHSVIQPSLAWRYTIVLMLITTSQRRCTATATSSTATEQSAYSYIQHHKYQFQRCILCIVCL